jgi:hypothetical protein
MYGFRPGIVAEIRPKTGCSTGMKSTTRGINPADSETVTLIDASVYCR